MLASGLSALVLPPSMLNGLRGQVDNLLIPVSLPARTLAAAASARWGASSKLAAPRDAQGRLRTVTDLQEQVEHQQVTIANLTKQMQDLREQVNARAVLGDLAQDCRSIQVWGNDAGTRQTLSLSSSTMGGLAPGMPAICAQGLVGRIEFAGLGGARVRLITDAEFTLGAEFGRFEQNGDDPHDVKFVQIPMPRFTCTGNGRGRMVVANLRMTDVQQGAQNALKVGDWMTLADPDDWPSKLQGYKLGKIEMIRPLFGHPLFAEIVVKPEVDLMKLKEVMVLVK